ncbi:MAG: hemolysin family protein [Bacteroidota bacterium]
MDPASSLGLLGPILLADIVLSPVGLSVQIGVFVCLLGLSALFSGSEVALFSITAGEREALDTLGSRSAKRVLALLDRPRRLLVAILMLNTVVNVGAAILSTQVVLAFAEAYAWSPTVVLVVNVLALTFILLVVSEIAPKLLASRQPVRFAQGVAPLLSPLVRLLSPVADLLAGLAMRLQTRFRADEDPLSSDDIKTMADVGEAQGSLEEEERALIHSIVEFGETTVREVMVSRVDMKALPETATLDDALDTIRESGHSRFPLYRDDLDHLLGVVYAKDLLPYLDDAGGDGAAPDIHWETIARQPQYVPPSKPLDDMLSDFQRTSTHMAIVVDEYGGTAGLVTLEDLLEEVVGEIRDELDDEEDETLIRQLDPDVWRAEARVDLDDLADAVGVELDADDYDFETLGGLIFHLTGDIPAPGDEIEHEGLRFSVETVEQNRIQDVRIETLPPTEPVDE